MAKQRQPKQPPAKVQRPPVGTKKKGRARVITVSNLNPGQAFELDGGSRLRLLYNVGTSRAYVQSLTPSHVQMKNGVEFDKPGEKFSIAVGTEIARLINEPND